MDDIDSWIHEMGMLDILDQSLSDTTVQCESCGTVFTSELGYVHCPSCGTQYFVTE